MSDPRIKDLIKHAVDDNAIGVQDKFAELALDRIRDLVDLKRSEVASNFMSATPEYEEIASEIEDALEDNPAGD